MALINKIYPAFYGGISEQADELILDTQCRDMVNCVPDIIRGLERRNGLEYVYTGESGAASRTFHTYDRGEGDEEYVFISTGSAINPLKILTKAGIEKTVTYGTELATMADYMSGDLKAVTIQDRTFIINKDRKVGISEISVEDAIQYYRRRFLVSLVSLNVVGTSVTIDALATINISVTLNGVVYTDTLSINELVTGEEGTSSTYTGTLDVTTQITNKVNALLTASPFTTYSADSAIRQTSLGTCAFSITVTGGTNTTLSESIYKMSDETLVTPSEELSRAAYYWLSRSSNDTNNTYNYAVYINETSYEFSSEDSEAAATGLTSLINGISGFTATAIGSVIRILSSDTFTYSSWDSWGNQASVGWQGTISKLSSLPSDMPFDGAIVEITGTDSNEFTDYYVIAEDGVWVETRSPEDLRGSFTDMPIYVDRLADGTFEVNTLSWEIPHIGDATTNPTPSFVGGTIQDIFFFKNRLGIASEDSVVTSEEGGYYNFYFTTVLSILDTDVIDIAIASNQASKIYYAVPFLKTLYLFTKESQFEVSYEGTFSPLTVSIDSVTNYDMDVNVQPKTQGNSLYFISTSSDNTSQLREYVKDEETLTTKGVNVTLNTPTLLPTISKIVTSTSLGIVLMYSPTNKDTLYVYRATESGGERIQSAVFKWAFPIDIEDIFLFDKELYITYEGTSESIITKMPILPVDATKIDAISSTETIEYESYVTLPTWYPKLSEMKTPLNKIQIKRATITGVGTFDVDIYRKSYDTTVSKTYSSLSTANNKASILGRTDDVEITIKSNSTDSFQITSLVLEGLYRQSSKEVK